MRLWLEGYSASVIAGELRKQGLRVSRSAVLGKIWRARQCGAGDEETARLPRKKKARIRKTHIAHACTRPEASARAEPALPAPAAAPDRLTTGDHVRGALAARDPAHEPAVHVIARRDGQCAWPLWGPDTPFADKLCCGRRVQAGQTQPYCPRHQLFTAAPAHIDGSRADQPGRAGGKARRRNGLQLRKERAA